jgi:CHAT domain-containing protein/tetratricopeptide (TPR) repeat protein
LHAAIAQQGIDLVAEVLDPAGRLALAVDSPTSDHGTELVCFEARLAGRHLLQLRSWKEGEEGDYEIQISQGPARPQDRRCAAALRAMKRTQKQLQMDTRLSEELIAGYRTASRLFREAGEPFHEAVALKEGCGVLLGLGRLEQAAGCYEQALEPARAAGDRRQEAEILNLLGLTQQKKGEVREARSSFDQALAISRAQAERGGEASALNNLALLDRIQGRHHQAIGRLELALEIWRSLGRRGDEAASLHNLGSIYTELGYFEEALDLLREALATRRQSGGPDLVAGTLVEIGWTHHLAQRPGPAVVCFKEAIALYRSAGRSLGEAAALDRLGSALRQAGRPERALAAYRRALQLSEQAGDRPGTAHVRTNLGWLLLEQGREAEAVAELGSAEATLHQLGEPEGRAHALVGLAAAARESGDLSLARRRLEQALGLIEEGRVSGRRAGYWIQSVSLWDDYRGRYVDLLVEHHSAGQDPKFLVRAFEAAEGSKSRNLQDMLLESQVDLREGIASRLQTREASVQEQLNATEERRRALLSTASGEASRAALERSLRSLRQEYHRIQAEIRAAHPRIASITRPQPLHLAEVQRLLDRRTRLLSFALGKRRSFLFLVGPDSLDCFELPPRQEIEAMARNVYEGLAHSGQRHAHRQAWLAAGTLARILLGPAHLPPEVHRLLIVPEGGLLYLPFSALPRPGEHGPGPPLVESYEVVHLPSAAALVALRQREGARPQPEKTLALLADPVFSSVDLRLEHRRAPAGRPARLFATLPPLPFTRQEAEEIQSLVPKEERLVALGLAAHRDLVLSGALADYRILHFATHAVIDERHPELSGLVLSAFGEDGRPRQPYLRLHEIYGLDLPADLVVLSACRTALGRPVPGDGLVGLTQGFLYAGSSQIIVSLWDAEDEATAALMGRFYQHLLRDGRSPAAALRASQLWLRRQPRWQAPFYWAGFVLQGDSFRPIAPL